MTFTPPPGYFLYLKKYSGTQAVITKTFQFHGWTYHSGHFHDGETFYQLGSNMFNNPQVDYSDLDFSAEEFDF